ncbi:MAG: multiheme c-type cytochrome [Spirochaetota bacterium]
MKIKIMLMAALCVLVGGIVAAATFKTGDALHGLYKYKDFQKATYCRQCHVEIYYQWKKSLMAQAFTHEWDEIEYFDMAVEHAKRNPKFKDAVDGCNGCHAPFSYMAGDTPPPRPEKRSMANEGVSCDVCHTINHFNEDKLYNYSYHSSPGRKKYGPRGGKNSPAHGLEKFDKMKTAEFCANCHNEKSPYDVWVKSTYNEWKEGPYSEEGVPCQDCHMPPAPGQRAKTEKKKYDDVRQHTFHGGHFPAKYNGAIDVLIYPEMEFVEPGMRMRISVYLYNQKCGHKVPTGSVEDRILYLHVEAEDSKGQVYHLKVDKKGFEGEEYTISSEAKAYQDLAEMMDVPDGFDGLRREDVPPGNRIFRMPFFTEKGQMTMAQWNTAKLGVDYRIGPRETKVETFTWTVPGKMPPGPVKVRAKLNYRLLVKPVAEFLKVPESEYKDRLINSDEAEFEVIY